MLHQPRVLKEGTPLGRRCDDISMARIEKSKARVRRFSFSLCYSFKANDAFWLLGPEADVCRSVNSFKSIKL